MHGVVYEGLYAYRSPSTRRAWIEILVMCLPLTWR